jgi:hypothetical protein
VALEDGVRDLAAWVAGRASADAARQALLELERYRLLR